MAGYSDAVVEIEQRLGQLAGAVPDAEANDFTRGYMQALRWAKERLDEGLRGLLPGVAASNGPGTADQARSAPPRGGGPVLLSAPPATSTVRCLAGKDHSYTYNTPEPDLKQCRHCEDTLEMTHGDRIAAGKRTRRPGQNAAAWTEPAAVTA